MVLGAEHEQLCPPHGFSREKRETPPQATWTHLPWSRFTGRRVDSSVASECWCPVSHTPWSPSPVDHGTSRTDLPSAFPTDSRGAGSEVCSPTVTSNKLESHQVKFPGNDGCILQASPSASLSANRWMKVRSCVFTKETEALEGWDAPGPC